MEWPEAPTYDVFDPKDVEPWALSMVDADVPFCIGADKRFEKLEPTAAFSPNGKHTVYIYTNRAQASSWVRRDVGTEPVNYLPVRPDDIVEKAVVRVTPANGRQMNFLKERYLARGIVHATGDLNFIVWVGERLAGGFIYKVGGDPRSHTGRDATNSIYLLSDFSVTRERRVSKLIAMLATARVFVDLYRRRSLNNPTHIVTTVFTKNPVSMKYRGVWDLASRKEGHLQYTSRVREQSPQEIYGEWFQRFGKP